MVIVFVPGVTRTRYALVRSFLMAHRFSKAMITDVDIGVVTEREEQQVRYVLGTVRFVRGEWRVWCYDAEKRYHYWGEPGDPRVVLPPNGERRYRKIPVARERRVAPKLDLEV
jgi:hypothetical protein